VFVCGWAGGGAQTGITNREPTPTDTQPTLNQPTPQVPVLEAYAMTEASHQMTSNPLPKFGPRKPGSVGKAQGGVSVAILDLEGNVLPQGEIGEVCIKGENVTAG
jgi:acyl-CoA synthetase (AMP-forming)/AMP-acid ligase II